MPRPGIRFGTGGGVVVASETREILEILKNEPDEKGVDPVDVTESYMEA